MFRSFFFLTVCIFVACMKQEIKKRFPDGIPLLNPKTDMNINEKAFTEVVNSIEAYETRLYSHPLHKSDQLEEVYAKYNEKVKVSFMIFCFYNMNVCVCVIMIIHADRKFDTWKNYVQKVQCD